MPLPQVNDRLKEIPAQALRTLFATVGQLLLVADRLRARAAEQLSDSGEGTDATPPQQGRPAQQARPAQKAPPAQRPPAQAPRRSPPGSPPRRPPRTRPRRRDRAMAVSGHDGQRQVARRGRGGDEEDFPPASAPARTADPAPSFQEPSASAAPAAPVVSEPSAPEQVTPAPAELVPPAAEYTPTEIVPAVPAAPPSPRSPRPPPSLPCPRAGRTRPPPSTGRVRPAGRPCRGRPARPQLRPAVGGLAAGPVARARCGPGARPARLREGTRGPASCDHHVRAPADQAQRRLLSRPQPASAARIHRSHPMALDTSPEAPVPVRTILRLTSEWIGRLGRVWVEGQIAELTRRGNTVFLTLRDPVAAVSVRVICPRTVLDATDPPPGEGARVLVWAKPDFNTNRGSFSLSATEIRAVGIGELLARLERLRRALAAEGLFAEARKRPLPFLPGKIGLICGRDSAAEKDVLRNSAHRWPAVQFRVEPVAVQGAVCGRRDRQRAAPAGRRSGGGRDRYRPGRRLDRGPAAVLRRDADPGRRRQRSPPWSAR